MSFCDMCGQTSDAKGAKTSSSYDAAKDRSHDVVKNSSLWDRCNKRLTPGETGQLVNQSSHRIPSKSSPLFTALWHGTT